MNIHEDAVLRWMSRFSDPEFLAVLDFDDTLYWTHHTREECPDSARFIEAFAAVQPALVLSCGNQESQLKKFASCSFSRHFSEDEGSLLILPDLDEKLAMLASICEVWRDQLAHPRRIMMFDDKWEVVAYAKGLGITAVRVRRPWAGHHAKEPPHESMKAHYEIETFDGAHKILEEVKREFV